MSGRFPPRIQLVIAALVVGCARPRPQEATCAPRYSMIRGGHYVVAADLFVVREARGGPEYLFRPGHRQLTPFSIAQFKGHPLSCPGFATGAEIVAVAEEGTRLLIVAV